MRTAQADSWAFLQGYEWVSSERGWPTAADAGRVRRCEEHTSMIDHCNLGWQAEGAQPLLTPDDCNDAEEIAKADPRVRELLKARGINDLDLVAADPWSVVRRLPWR